MPGVLVFPVPFSLLLLCHQILLKHICQCIHVKIWGVKTRTIIIIIIALKGAIRDCSQSPHCAANRLQHVCSSGLGAIMCKSRATHRALITCNMSYCLPRGTKGQLSYWIWQSWNRIYFNFYFIGWIINQWRRGGNRSTRRKPLATSLSKADLYIFSVTWFSF